MKPVVVALIVVVLVVVVVGAWIASWVYWRRRRERWAVTAAGLGFTVAEGAELLERFGALPLFQRGRDRSVYNLLRGSTSGLEAWIADYLYETGRGKGRQQHRATVCVLRTPGRPQPRFELAPEDPISHRLGPLLGIREVDFGDDPGFSSAYRVVGPDEAAIRAAFTPDVRSRLLRRPTRIAHLEAEGEAMLVHDGRLVDPGAARDLLQLAREVRSYFG